MTRTEKKVNQASGKRPKPAEKAPRFARIPNKVKEKKDNHGTESHTEQQQEKATSSKRKKAKQQPQDAPAQSESSDNQTEQQQEKATSSKRKKAKQQQQVRQEPESESSDNQTEREQANKAKRRKGKRQQQVAPESESESSDNQTEREQANKAKRRKGKRQQQVAPESESESSDNQTEQQQEKATSSKRKKAKRQQQVAPESESESSDNQTEREQANKAKRRKGKQQQQVAPEPESESSEKAQQKPTPPIKRPFRYRPGTVALRDSIKTRYLDNKSDKRDTLFEVSSKLESTLLRVPTLTTRNAWRVFYHIASNLPVLGRKDQIWHEAQQHDKFYIKVWAMENKDRGRMLELEQTKYFESEKGIWFCKKLRWRNLAHRTKAMHLTRYDRDNSYLKRECLLLCNIVAELRTLLKTASVPICILAGTKKRKRRTREQIEKDEQENAEKPEIQGEGEKVEEQGSSESEDSEEEDGEEEGEVKIKGESAHCVAIFIYPGRIDSGGKVIGRRACIKDSRSIVLADVHSLCADLLRDLGIYQVKVVGASLVEQDGGDYTDCVKLAYVEAANILDGYYGLKMPVGDEGCSRYYNITAKKWM